MLVFISHAPIEAPAQIGGATGLIGDPSGRKTEREPANVAQVEKNVEMLSDSIRTFFRRGLLYAKSRLPSFSGSTCDPEIKSNLEWHKNFTMLEFLRVVGVHSRVNTMLSKERYPCRSSVHCVPTHATFITF